MNFVKRYLLFIGVIPFSERTSFSLTTQHIHNKGFKYQEQCSTIMLPDGHEVFLNEDQRINRDISCLMVHVLSLQSSFNHKTDGEEKIGSAQKYGGGLRVLDAFAASGIRAIRYFKEIPAVKHITLNDLDKNSIKNANSNLIMNQIPNSCFALSEADANVAMSEFQQHNMDFDVIDLDPFGSVAPFLESAVTCLSEGGILCVNCMLDAISQPNKCFEEYESIPMTEGKKPSYFHELAIRILLHQLECCAFRHERYIEPVLSVTLDHYIRVYIRLFKSTKTTTEEAYSQRHNAKSAYIYQSKNTLEFYLQPISKPTTAVITEAVQQGTDFTIGGPIWSGCLHNSTWLEQAKGILLSDHFNLLQSTDERNQVLKVLLQALREDSDIPLSFKLIPDIQEAANVKHMPRMLVFLSLLRNSGFRASKVQREAGSVKTDAPLHTILQLVRAWDKMKWEEKMEKDPEKMCIPASVSDFTPDVQINSTIPEDLLYSEREMPTLRRKRPLKGSQRVATHQRRWCKYGRACEYHAAGKCFFRHPT